jgi:hypothetical protein
MDNLRIVCNISPWTRNVFDLWPKQVSYSVEDSESPVTSMGDEVGRTSASDLGKTCEPGRWAPRKVASRGVGHLGQMDRKYR